MSIINQLRYISKNEGFLKYFKNTSWLFAEKLLRMIAGLSVGSWLGRFLGPADYGAFQYAISVVSVFTVIATLGLDQIVIRELVKESSDRNKLLGTSFLLKFAGALLGFIILAICLPFLEHEEVVDKMIFIIASSMILHSFNVIDFHFQSKVLSKYVVYANIISLLVASIAKIVLILIDGSLEAFAIVTVFEALVLALGYLYYYLVTNKSASIFDWKFDKEVAKSLLTDSWPLIFGGVVIIIQARIDQVMLKRLSTNEEVGYYSVALRLIEMLGFIPVLLQTSLFPSLVNSKNVSIELYKDRLLNFYRLNFIFFIITAVPIYLFADWIILFLYGHEYAPAIPLLAFMTSRIILANMGVARTSFITIENLFKFSMVTMIIGTVINVVLNYFLIPEYLSMGAIFATIVSFSFTTFILDFFYKRTRENAFMQIKSMLTFYAIKLQFLKNKED